MPGLICERCKQEIKNPFDPVPIGEYILFKNVGGYAADELLKRVERLNRIYDAGLMSLSEYGERLKEWMQK